MATTATRVGIDIGGTFTDLVLTDDVSGRYLVVKLLTTPSNPANAVAEALAAAVDRFGADSVEHVVHGTTLMTNAVIERKGACTGLLVTEGFRDSLEIATEHRYNMYDLNIEKPSPLVPRELRLEVRERMLADGSVLVPVSPETVERAAAELRSREVDSVAVCFLHSYANPEHERAAAQILGRLLPGVTITLSSDVSPEIREYPRMSTTVVNAYVMPLMDRYLRELEQKVEVICHPRGIYLMLSSGGICTLATARRYPVRLIESGPAAGVLAAAHFGGIAGFDRLLSFDMGGTTAKAGLIEGGKPMASPDFEVARVYRFNRGSGLPLQVRTVELIEIGAGGGSIASIDRLGLLKVGPDSAGSEPGPACYQRGGKNPTVTDADLVLGYLDPAFFAGGSMRLSIDAAQTAIEESVARPLGISVTEAALAIHRVVNENMASAARIHAIERGKNVRSFPLYGFGGGGPVHAWGIAKILGLRQVVIPFGAGIMSAAGLLVAPLAFDFVRSYQVRLSVADWERVAQLYGTMEAEAGELLTESGLAPNQIAIKRVVSARYVGQGNELEVTLPQGPVRAATADDIRAAFEKQYAAQYGVTHEHLQLEVLTWRLIASGPPLGLAQWKPEATDRPRRKTTRPIYFGEIGAYSECPVYDRYALRPRDVLTGPAVIEERESTIVVGPDTTVTIDDHHNALLELVLERVGEG
ncbi:MAG: hydantoinase/oxoprolinase family protein [Candidatus Acidiferrales bacterium]